MYAPRQPGADPGECSSHTHADVGCTADDAKTSRRTGIDIANTKPIRVGMALDAEHSRDKNVSEARDNLFEGFNFQPCHRQPPAKLLSISFDCNEFAQPAQREFHNAASRERK